MRRGALVAAALACACALSAQTYVPGPQVLTFLSDVDDSQQPYALYLPRHFDPSRRYPLVVSLHGEGSNHRWNLAGVFGARFPSGEMGWKPGRPFPIARDVDCIVACPSARGSMGYQGIAEKDVYDMLADVRRRFPIDGDRVYLTGTSTGGGGTLWLGLTRPDRWAAIAAVSAEPPAGTADLAPNALDLPVRLYQGADDPVVPVSGSRQWNKRLANQGTDVEYIEYPGVRHNAWDSAYKDAAIFDWFAKHRRNPFPERVRFVSSAYRYNSAYWVHVDGLTPGTLATIDARFTGRNRIEVTTENLDGFTLKLDGHPSFSPRAAVALTIDGEKFSLAPRQYLSFEKAGAKWRAGRYRPAPGDKRPGLEGPIADAIASRHIYVYGTEGASGDEQIDARHHTAVEAADWSTPESRLQLLLPALADRSVPEEQIARSNLVLFGTRQTNRLIERFAAQFPLELNPGAADYGLLFVIPVAGRYILVNSGLPFRTVAGGGFEAPAYRLLSGLGDYVLFRGSLENVIAGGRFDRSWKVPAAEAARLRATGAVTIR